MFPWRKKSATLYVRILSEVLLQRTRAETVATFLPMFMKRFSSWNSLAKTSRSEIERRLRPIGLWRMRARFLRELASELVLRKGRFPRAREEIELLPGVGQYITNAVLLFCHDERQPLLDVNMARVLERYFGPRKLADIRYDPYLQSLARSVVQCKDPVSVNWALLDFASLVCKQRKPLCRRCPLCRDCRYGLANSDDSVGPHQP